MLRAKMLFQYSTFHHIKAHNFEIKLKLKFLHKNCDIHITLLESHASGRGTAFTKRIRDYIFPLALYFSITNRVRVSLTSIFLPSVGFKSGLLPLFWDGFRFLDSG